MGEHIQFTDRYDALGLPQPDPETMCRGQCEGTGFVPVHRHDLWRAAELVKPTDDDYHFVKCPACKGARLAQ